MLKLPEIKNNFYYNNEQIITTITLLKFETGMEIFTFFPDKYLNIIYEINNAFICRRINYGK